MSRPPVRPARDRLRLGALELTDGLGEGALGRVWRALTPDGTRVAVKVARSAAAADPRTLRLLAAEVRAMARLDHPHVLAVLDHGTVPADHLVLPPGAPFFVLEHCGGGTLADQVPPDWPSLARTLALLLSALAHAHSRDLVHRDLKPGNVLFAGPDDLRPGLKLADFGVAHAIGVGGGPRIAGTPRYMPPEQLDGELERQGPWTDLFALGVVAWELAHRTSPLFDASGAPRWTPPRFALPEGWHGFVTGLTAPDPADRFRSANAAWRALAELAPGTVDGPPTGWRGASGSGSVARVQGAGLGLVALREHELVGRVAERRRLWEELESAVRGDGPRVVVVRGPRGIGRSRLLGWLAARAREDGRAHPAVVPGASSAAPLSALLASALRLTDVPRARRAAAVLAGLRRLGLEEDHVAVVEDLLARGGGSWGRAPAVREALRVIAATEPLVVCLDDADHGEAAFELARGWMAEREPAAPVLLVLATAQPDGAEAEPEDAVTLRLGPLSPPESDRVVSAWLDLEPAVAAELVERSGGHPGFLVRAVLGWSGAGLLAPHGGRLGLEGGPVWPEGGLDPRVLAELCDQAPEHAVVALELAAAQGPQVDEELWEETADDRSGPGLDPDRVRWRLRLVQRLLDAGLAIETERGFAFTDPSLVEALVAAARTSGRAAAHDRVLGEAWSARGDRLRAGTHLARAGELERALPLVLEGAREAFFVAPRSVGAAVALGRELLDRLAVPERDARRATWALVAGSAELLAGAYATSFELTQRALAIADAIDAPELAWQVRVRLVDLLASGGRWLEAEQWLEELVAAPATPAHQRVRALGRLGVVRLHQDRREEALARFDAAERLLDTLPRDTHTLTARVELADFRADPDRSAESVATCIAAIDAAHAQGRLQDERYLVGRLFLLQQEAGDLDALRTTGRRLQRLAMVSGNRRGMAIALGMLARVEVRWGEPGRAAELVDAALRWVAVVEDAELQRNLRALRVALAARRRDLEAFELGVRQLGQIDAVEPGQVDPETEAWMQRQLDRMRSERTGGEAR